VTPPTILDAIDLATRAAYYRRVWLGERIPVPDMPEYLWADRPSYYGRQALDVYIQLEARAAKVLLLAVCGIDEEYGAAARALTPEQVRERGQLLAERVECGLILADTMVERALRGVLDEVHDWLAGADDDPRGAHDGPPTPEWMSERRRLLAWEAGL